MENKTALQYAISGIKRTFGERENISQDDLKRYLQSLLPLEKERYRECFDAGWKSLVIKTAPDFSTYFSRYEKEQSSNQ